MSLFSLFSLLHKIFPARSVFAHCDIPCGIYSMQPALTAAHTVIKMTERIVSLPPVDEKDALSVQNFHNAMTRYVMAKEEHAQLCKKELLVLWTDYFKPEHVVLFPDLHEKFWKAAKLCSQVKQEVSMEAATQLRVAVEEIADMFEKTHAASH
jgi:nickel superoxide dismutase